MRVAILTKLEPVDGVAVYSRQLAAWLTARGDEADTYYFGRPPATAGAAGEHDVALPAAVRTPGYTVALRGARRTLREALAARPPDLIHAQLPTSELDFVLPRLARQLGAPLVGTYHHGWDYRPTRYGLVAQAITRAYAAPLKRYDRVIVFGSRVRAELERLGVTASRIGVVPNGVDTAAYAPGPSPHRLTGQLRVTYMGRMTADKNVRQLVETFVQANAPGLRLTLVGKGPEYDAMKGRHGDHPGVDWVGFVGSADERRSIWRGTDVVALPSPIEGLSLSLLEGMSSGCMPLATDVGEHRDVLAGVGITLDPLNVREGLANAWRWLSEHPEEVRAEGGLARRRVLDEYRSELHWERLARLYAGAVAEGRGLGR